MEALQKFIVGDNNLRPKTPWGGWAAFFMSISFIGFQFLIIVVLGLGVVLAMYGVEVFRGEYSATDIPTFVNIGIFTILTSYILTYGLILFVGILRGGTIAEVLLLKAPVKPVSNMIFAVLALLVFFFGFSLIVDTFFASDGVESEAQMKEIFGRVTQAKFAWAGVAIVVVGAPFLEETIFRGFLLAGLAQTRLGFWGAAAVSSAAWATLHGYAASMAGGLFVFGMLLSLMVRRTGSIWVSIVLHAIWNGGATMAVIAAMGS